MNWTCVVYGGPMILAMLWFAIDARKWFKGPRVHLTCWKQIILTLRSMLNIACWAIQGTNVLEGKVADSPESGSVDHNVKIV